MEIVEDLDLGSQSQCREVDGVLEAGLEEAWLQIWPGVQLALAQESGEGTMAMPRTLEPSGL